VFPAFNGVLSIFAVIHCIDDTSSAGQPLAGNKKPENKISGIVLSIYVLTGLAVGLGMRIP
jgi:hypothetical protein